MLPSKLASVAQSWSANYCPIAILPAWYASLHIMIVCHSCRLAQGCLIVMLAAARPCRSVLILLSEPGYSTLLLGRDTWPDKSNQCIIVQPPLMARPVRLALLHRYILTSMEPNRPSDVAPASVGSAWANCAWARCSTRCNPWGLGACGPSQAGDWAIRLGFVRSACFFLQQSCLEGNGPIHRSPQEYLS